MDQETRKHGGTWGGKTRGYLTSQRHQGVSLPSAGQVLGRLLAQEQRESKSGKETSS